MIFGFGKKEPSATPQPAPAVAWDAKTVASIVQADRFDVKITSAEKRRGFGSTDRGGAMREPDGYEICGLLTYPKFISVSLNFDSRPANDNFGLWFYHLMTGIKPSRDPDLPILEIFVADPESRIREALYEALRDSLIAGNRYATARCWKNKDEGTFSAKDQEHGWSYESRFPLLGMYVFTQLESPQLPPWAVSTSSDRFSTKNMPEWYDLELHL
jgi:hypothetical protein